MEERRGYRIEGRVQGVGFRWWAQRTASALGLRGDVRNRPDGCVELVAEGDAHALDALAEALKNGPVMARVDAVKPIAADGVVPEAGFLIEGR